MVLLHSLQIHQYHCTPPEHEDHAGDSLDSVSSQTKVGVRTPRTLKPYARPSPLLPFRAPKTLTPSPNPTP
ncbi:hypothetical protein K432DRAFT_182571 [Lepidopterella palustris CBS 459.81]|uniref:Uncharacterized protein n=1 Tax=Lepidopterella palustris CBS 459.81 TaxID=1314670 RepID=A0A8E2JA38_9PEZI|nr:hypothetical protein K432DRAFT_182571 [Lepidopterella palustris CBS 459.81]